MKTKLFLINLLIAVARSVLKFTAWLTRRFEQYKEKQAAIAAATPPVPTTAERIHAFKETTMNQGQILWDHLKACAMNTWESLFFRLCTLWVLTCLVLHLLIEYCAFTTLLVGLFVYLILCPGIAFAILFFTGAAAAIIRTIFPTRSFSYAGLG